MTPAMRSWAGALWIMVGNRFAPVDFGAVTTGAGLPFEQRLSEVYDGVCEVIHRTRPEVLAIEKLFYQHNQTTVIGVAEARGGHPAGGGPGRPAGVRVHPHAGSSRR